MDLIIDLGARLVPVEIKSGATVARDAFAGLDYWIGLAGSPDTRGVLVSGGDGAPYRYRGHLVRPWYACS